ncbi:MAG: aminoacetone oxidase family FAD-binding enzyme [Anaerococcus sp.]|nr:aminoacetone oxidase family FAD-binding enzyme [Peptoniphilaceae bacterium]MDY3054732.1 aminoacetone oxidase family FAD-binding enzyme [Anaerococcus sp.]
MKIFVIGAGVASLAFCSFFEENLINVIEKNSFAGRKLLATGNGRCNFTNLNLSYDKYLSENKGFVNYALDNFTNKDLLKHFESMGVEWTSLESGRAYPRTMSSKTVRDALFLEAKDKANFIFDQEIIDIDFKNKLLITDSAKYKYDVLVIGSGGVTLKNSGSDGKILELLRKKTKLVPSVPAITNYAVKKPYPKACKGTKLRARASLFVDGKKIKESTDDVIFQSYGLTGTAILDLSNQASHALSKKKDVRVDIDFYPEYSYNTLLEKLKTKAKKYPHRSLDQILLGFLHENLIGEIIKRSGAKKTKRKIEALEKISSYLKKASFDLTDIHDKTNAQVSLGGVATDRIDPRTMKSLDIEDTYFIGEVMDVAGDCGGYNIQWAFSSAKACSDDIRRLYVKDK